MKTDNNMVLNFDNVHFQAKDGHTASLSGVTLGIQAGSVALVRLTDEVRVDALLCDLAEGLDEPDNGSVTFCGVDWRNMDAEAQQHARGSIGRVFNGPAWLSNLNLYDNLTLSVRHHSEMDDNSVRAEVMRMCSLLRLEEALDVSPELYSSVILKKMEWIRAFLGKRTLLVMESPESGVKVEDAGRLIDLVNSFVEGGGAVLWVTASDAIVEDKRLLRAQRYCYCNGRLQSAMGAK